ncbi:MAG: hypothetical protein E8D52_09215 [Nitrospira sp.]|nr:MAG: hypothetical protein E8D52_09215 [Nitrospira sp.]
MRTSYSSTPDPMRHLEIFGFLARHYKKLARTLDRHLKNESQAFDRKVTKLRVSTARESLKSWALKDLYPDAARYGIFIAMYSQFEYYLNETCKELEPMHKIKLSDLDHRGIQKVSVYLTKVAGIESPFSDNSWQKLNDLNKLRNQIVHANGRIDSTNKIKDVVERINTWAPLSTEDSRITLSREFNPKISDMLHSSAKELFTKLRSYVWT